MKKLLIGILVVGLIFCGLVYAGGHKIQIIDQELDDVDTTVVGIRGTGSYERIGFFIDYDETDTGSLVSVAVTVDISHDGENWIDADFSDFAAVGETSETISEDGCYFFWFDDTMQIPFVRLSIVATGTTDTLLADVDGYVVGFD